MRTWLARGGWVGLALVAACSSSTDRVSARNRDGAASKSTAPSSPSTPAAAPGTVYVRGASGEVAITVEVVDTDATIQQGLMYRTFLGPDAGMLFVPRLEQEWRFWMRNTLIPLDMIFIARDLTIAGIVENAVPHDETSRSVDKPSLFILEVNGGWCKAHGVVAGAAVRFDGIAAVAKP